MGNDKKVVMTEKKINWDKVEAIKDESLIRTCTFKFNNQSIKIDNLKIEYKIYEFKYSKDKNYYQRVITLPFFCKSNWGSIPLEDDKVEANIVQLLQSKLIQKYKDVLARNHNNIEFKKQLNEAASEILSDKDYPSRLYHGSLIKKINGIRIGNIWNKFKAPSKKTFAQADIDLEKTSILAWNKFVKLIVDDKCAYCGVSVEQINKIKLMTKRARGYTLEVDQKDPYGTYTDCNCVACCYWCNNAKTDEFTVLEFQPIAKGINEIWKCRLKNAGLTDKIIFPTEVYKDNPSEECK